jgi:hypothetical protein
VTRASAAEGCMAASTAVGEEAERLRSLEAEWLRDYVAGRQGDGAQTPSMACRMETHDPQTHTRLIAVQNCMHPSRALTHAPAVTCAPTFAPVTLPTPAAAAAAVCNCMQPV